MLSYVLLLVEKFDQMSVKKRDSQHQPHQKHTNQIHSWHSHYCFIFSTVAIAEHIEQHCFLTLLNGILFDGFLPAEMASAHFLPLLFPLNTLTCKIEWLSSTVVPHSQHKQTHSRTHKHLYLLLLFALI